MTQNYTPPKIWSPEAQSSGQWAKTNRPEAGERFERVLPVGRHPLQLYSLATPNGVKVTFMLEELLALGIEEAEYDAWLIDITEGDQFGSGFVEINPNSKIPAMVDHSIDPPLPVFESGAILQYLAEKFNAFLPEELAARTRTLSWLHWQVGAAPFLGGGFGHFYAYAPEKYKYPIDRYTMEVKRQLDLLNRHLKDNEYMAGDAFTIADIAIAPWYGELQAGLIYNAGEFLQVQQYGNLERWRKLIFARPAYQRGRMVNKIDGDASEQLHERHDKSDFHERTQDKYFAGS